MNYGLLAIWVALTTWCGFNVVYYASGASAVARPGSFIFALFYLVLLICSVYMGSETIRVIRARQRGEPMPDRRFLKCGWHREHVWVHRPTIFLGSDYLACKRCGRLDESSLEIGEMEEPW